MRIFIILVFTIFSSLLLADSDLKIGCTYSCNENIKKALIQSAALNQVNLEIFDLSKNERINWKDLDGVLIPGGVDINPNYYLPYVDFELQTYTRGLDHFVRYTNVGVKRDLFEYEILREYFQANDLETFPLLGICRGMQMMAVAQGIPLYVDIKIELGIENRLLLYDQILMMPGSSLMNTLFADTFRAFKNHHQGIRVDYYNKHIADWPNVRLTAFSNKGIIAESMEIRNRTALGIQFHPEKNNNQVQKKIFNWFIEKAIIHHRVKQKVPVSDSF